jgi:hypothetical protein
MKKLTFVWLLILWFPTTYTTRAAEMLLTGVYHGTNIFVITDKDESTTHCINEIYVNNHKIDFVPSSYIEINLSHLKVKDAVIIKIVHKDDCLPTIKNIHAIKAKEVFQFEDIDLSPEKLIWLTRGEKKFGQFFIEIFKNNVWTVEKVLNGKGKAIDNSYELVLSKEQTQNKLRIKYLEPSGKATYSQELVLKE